MKARWCAVFAAAAAAMLAVAGCDAERVLAVKKVLDASVNPDAPVNPSDAGTDVTDAAVVPGDAGQPFGTPQVVTGLRPDPFEVRDPSMTFEELELYFTSSSTAGGLTDIWVAKRLLPTDPWGPGTLVTELSSPQSEKDPEVSVDGLNMFFASDRGSDGMRLYVARRRTRDTPWEPPLRVNGSLGSSVADEAPAVDRGQLYLIFASQRGAAMEPHLYAATRPDSSAVWTAAGELTALNSAARDTDPALFGEGRGLVFASRRTAPGTTIGTASDLFQTARTTVESPFTARVEPISELNTAAFSEEDPWLSQDGRHILFVSDRDGRARIYEARR